MMSLNQNENDDNSSVAASDFAQFDQPDEVLNQQEAQQQQEHTQFGLHQNVLDWTMNKGNTRNYEHELKEQKLMIANLEVKNQNLQAKLEILELKAENRALKENAEQKANYQTLEAKMNGIEKMLSTQNEQHQGEMAQLEEKNRKLEEKLGIVELQTKGTTKNGALEGKMELLKDQFATMLAEQQKQMMAQFNCMEQKLKEAAEQRAQMEKNKLEETIQQKLEKFGKEMEESVNQAIGSNQMKLDYMWGQLMTKSQKILANPKGLVWNGLNTKAHISECGMKATNRNGLPQWVFSTEGLAISADQCRKDNLLFSGTIVYYFEATITTGVRLNSVGFSDGNAGYTLANSYAIKQKYGDYEYWLSGKQHKYELPPPIGDEDIVITGGVFGCGLLLNPKNEWAIFFTLNGMLLGKQTRINPTVDRLYPTVYMYYTATSVEANFGENLVDKPFHYDIDKCPGLDFE